MDEIKKYLTANTKKILDLLSEGVVITDEQMVVRYVNMSFLEYAGMPKEDIFGKKFTDVRPTARMPEVLASKKPWFNVHRLIPYKDSFTESYVDIIPIFKGAEIIGAMVVVRDAKVLKDLFERINEKNVQVEQLGSHLRSVFKVDHKFENIIGTDSSFGKLAQKASKSDGAVLLMGESGTGKEVMAQSIHNASSRKHGPFVDINCAALPGNLLESELFGYAPGAFTGAGKSGKMGLFEVAHGGTIFLDEITELPMNLQARLLRVLQEKHMRRLGENKNIEVDVRVIAASNKNVEKLVVQNLFREDLFFRLAMFVIHLPPLRERKKDLSSFIHYFLAESYRKVRRKIAVSTEAMDLLLQYNWPGNVREVKNAIAYACDVVEGSVIKPEDLPGYVFRRKDFVGVDVGNLLSDKKRKLPDILDEVEKKILQAGIEEFGSSLEGRTAMAKALGVSIATLYNKMRKHSLL